MWKCPICGNSTSGSLVCLQCGFDGSSDREIYPTLMRPTSSRKAKSALRKSAFEIVDGVLQAYHGTETCVVVPRSVSALGEECFKECTTIEEVQLPAGLEKIDTACFSGCQNLKKINIPASVKQIGFWAFTGCVALQEIQLPKGLKEIGAFTFEGCTSLAEINIPVSVKQIGLDAFSGCTTLREIQLPEELEEIGTGSFCGSALKKITIPARVKRVGREAFSGCAALQSIVILSAKTVVKKDAFQNCPGKIIWPAGGSPEEKMKKLSEYMRNAQLMGFQTRDDVLEKYTGIESEVIVPWWVREIGPKAFAHDRTITRVDLPEELRRIGKDAFVGCSKLEHIDFPKGLQEIGESAFYDCDSLEIVCLDVGNRPQMPEMKIGSLAFAGCTALKGVYLSGGLQEIPEYAFSQCRNLENVEIGCAYDPDVECMEHIAKGAFKGCENLKEIDLPDTVRFIEEDAFAGCKKLEEMVLPFKARVMPGAFEPDCRLRKDFEIENGTLLAYRGWQGTILVPEEVVRIGENAFAESSGWVRTVLCGENVRAIGAGAFMMCEELEEFYPSGDLRSIGEGAFAGCKNLKEFVDRMEKLETIGKEAFRGCTSLKYISLPDTIQSIGENAFEGCDNLTEIVLPEKMRTLPENMLRNDPRVRYYKDPVTRL